jgi:hypothetical protein
LLATTFLFPVLIPLAVALLLTPLYATRYATLGLPLGLLLAATGLLHLERRTMATLFGLLIALTGVSLYRYAAEPQKDDWRSASAAILDNARDNEPVLFDSDHEIRPFRYYAIRQHHPMPDQAFGLLPVAGEANVLRAVGFRRGNRAEWTARDYTADITAAPGLWLALCLPVVPAEDYEGFFAQHGFVLERAYHFYRVDVYHFTRVPAPRSD